MPPSFPAHTSLANLLVSISVQLLACSATAENDTYTHPEALTDDETTTATDIQIDLQTQTPTDQTESAQNDELLANKTQLRTLLRTNIRCLTFPPRLPYQMNLSSLIVGFVVLAIFVWALKIAHTRTSRQDREIKRLRMQVEETSGQRDQLLMQMETLESRTETSTKETSD